MEIAARYEKPVFGGSDAHKEEGVGYAYTRYDRFRCAGCGKRIETDRPHHYVGPTKAAVNLVYVF